MHDALSSFRLHSIIACFALLCGLFACGSAAPPECKCDAAITKLQLEQPDAGGSALYGLLVNYSGHPSCNDGLLCVEDPLPTGLTCNPSDPAYTNPSPTNPDWNCSCNGGTSVKCCYNHPLPATSTNLPMIQVPVLVAPKAPSAVRNCASILQDFPGSFEDNTDANNTSCVNSEVLACQNYQKQYISGVIDNFATQNGPESPSPSPNLLGWINANYIPNLGVRDYDVTTDNQYFGHTFSNLVPQPGHFLAGGTLTLAVRCPQDNDAISLRFTTSPTTFDPQIWSQKFFGSSFLNVPCSLATSSTFTLDLNNLLPSLGVNAGLTSVLSGITTHHFLDVLVQDDTGVDYLALDLDYRCNGDPTDPTGVVAAMPVQAK